MTITPGVNSSRPLSPQGALVVQNLLPPVADDVLRDVDGDHVARALGAEVPDVLQDRVGDLPVGRGDTFSGTPDAGLLPGLDQPVGLVRGRRRPSTPPDVLGRAALAKASARRVGLCSLLTSTMARPGCGSVRSWPSSSAVSAATRSRSAAGSFISTKITAIAMIAIYAPCRNLEISTMISTVPVIVRPIPLITRERIYPAADRGDRLGLQEPGPVPQHAGLADRERDEDTDDVELDQGGDVRLEGDDQTIASAVSTTMPLL